MPWFKVDDTLHSHPKGRRAGLAAMGLWALSGAHSMAYKGGGFVPEWFVTSWPSGKRHATDLVRAGLWHEAEQGGEKGWRFHDWEHFQPSEEEIERDRQMARDRQRKRRQKLREARASQEEGK